MRLGQPAPVLGHLSIDDSMTNPELDTVLFLTQDPSEAAHLAWSCAVVETWLACIEQLHPHIIHWTCQQTPGRTGDLPTETWHCSNARHTHYLGGPRSMPLR